MGKKRRIYIIAKNAKIHQDIMCYREVTNVILNDLEFLCTYIIAYKLLFKPYFIFTTTVKEVPCEK